MYRESRFIFMTFKREKLKTCTSGCRHYRYRKFIAIANFLFYFNETLYPQIQRFTAPTVTWSDLFTYLPQYHVAKSWFFCCMDPLGRCSFRLGLTPHFSRSRGRGESSSCSWFKMDEGIDLLTARCFSSSCQFFLVFFQVLEFCLFNVVPCIKSRPCHAQFFRCSVNRTDFIRTMYTSQSKNNIMPTCNRKAISLAKALTSI